MIRSRSASPVLLLAVSVLALTLATLTALPAPAGAIPLGPPGSGFPRPTTSGWQAINGPYSNFDGGDPYATKCAGHEVGPSSCDSAGLNPLYQSTGEELDVEVPAGALGAPVTVVLQDPAFNLGGPGNDSYAGNASQTGFATSYQLFDTTGDPDVISTAPANGMNALGLCTSGPGDAVFSPTRKVANSDAVLCTFTPTVAGIYPVMVKTSAIPGVADAGGGQNDFGISASSPITGYDQLSVSPRLFSSVRVMTPGKTGDVVVAQTHTGDAGHELLIDLFDPGDSPSGTVSMQLQPPDEPSIAIHPPVPPQACSYSTPSLVQGGGTMIASPTCTITTRNAGAKVPTPYDGRWLRIETQIQTTACYPVCTWYLTYTSTKAGLDDRLTTVADSGPAPSSPIWPVTRP